MRVTPPISITASKLTSSTATAVHDPAAYAGSTTYAFGAIAKVAADFKIYESLAASNTGNTPSTSPLWWRVLGTTEAAYSAGTTYALGDTCSASNRTYESLAASNLGNALPISPEIQTTNWIDVGPTNRYAMFDLSANTQTVTASPLTVVITPGERINTVGLTGLKANQAVISATSVLGGGTVYPAVTIDLNTREVADGYDYAFEPFSTSPGAVIFDIPPYSDIIVTIALTSTSGNVKCGSCVLGTYIYLGDSQYGATNDGLNFSTVTRDLYGNAVLVPRRTLPKTAQKLTVSAARVNKVKAARVLLNATPALWTGLDDSDNSYFDMLTILGVYTQFIIGAVHNDRAEVTLALEEI